MYRTISPREGSWFPSRSRCRRMPGSIWFRRRRARIRRSCTHSGNGWSLPPLLPPRANPEPVRFFSHRTKDLRLVARLWHGTLPGHTNRAPAGRISAKGRIENWGGSLVLAFCPPDATIGVAAPIIVLIGRLLQGFSAGVELGGVSVYLAEISTPGNRGFYTSFQSPSQQVAIFVAAILGFVLSEMMPADTVAAWGWRIPFFIGCLIIPFIFLLRRTLEGSPEFLKMKKHPTASEVFASAVANWRIVILGMMIAVLTTTTFYFVTVYTPTF